MVILASHANAYPKELYEPFWDELFHLLSRTKRVQIRSIWIADMSNQGRSGVLNESVLGNDRKTTSRCLSFAAPLVCARGVCVCSTPD